MKKRQLIISCAVIAMVVLIMVLANNKKQETPEDIAKCISQNAVIYVQLGCHACGVQEEMFGDSYRYITEVDCFYEKEKCSDIQKTPTWIIKGQKYEGVRSIEELQNLTNCK